LERASQQQAASSSTAASSRARLQTRQRNFEEQRFHDPELEAKVLNIYYAEQYSAQTDVPDADAEAETATVLAAGQTTPCTSADNDTAMQLDGTEAAAAAPTAAAAAAGATEQEVGDTDPVPAGAAAHAADSDLSSSSAQQLQQQQQQAQQLLAACLPQQLLTASLPHQHAGDGRCLQPALSTPSSSAPGQDQQQQLLQQQPEVMHWERHPASNQHLTTAALTQQQQQQQVPADTGLAGPLPNLDELLGGLQPGACVSQAQQKQQQQQQQQDSDLGFGTLLRMGSSAAAELLGQALEELAAAEGAAAAAAAAAAAVHGDCGHYQGDQGAGPAHSAVPVCSDAHNSSHWGLVNGLLQPTGQAAAGNGCDTTQLILPSGTAAAGAAAAAASGSQLPQPARQHQQQHQHQQVCVAASPGAAAAAAGSGLQEQACLPVEDLSDPLLGLALSPADVEALLASVAAVDAASLGTQHSTAQHTTPPAAWVQQPTWQPGYAANQHYQQQQQLLQLHTASLQQQQQQQRLYHDVYGSYSIDSTKHGAAAGPTSRRAAGRAWPAGGIAADASLLPAQAQHSMQCQEPHLSQQRQQQWQQQQQQQYA
jgi:hypothetical protein